MNTKKTHNIRLFYTLLSEHGAWERFKELRRDAEDRVEYPFETEHPFDWLTEAFVWDHSFDWDDLNKDWQKILSDNMLLNIPKKTNSIDKIHIFESMNIKTYFTPFLLQVLNLEGIEDAAGVDRGTIGLFLNGEAISSDDLKALKTIVKMIKNI